MKSNKNLILIGMMGSGKSTVGRVLAQKLNLKFFDIDFLIEKKTNMKISEIFAKKGEDEFRNLEKAITLKFLNKTNCVISLGGGAFINEIIKKKVKKKGITVWLNWNSQTLINRIRKNKKRPIALNLDNNELKDLINSRSKIYAEANYKINCENMNTIGIVKKITQIYEHI
jgi:shikimate kinase